ncbi:DNA polymerase I [Candidatus Chloroploca sp. Khr17]|uniref:DNA polymerase I n=1 Tax=Candidatus Chloroploca sp. Khr17 TaxID=2496869 RepID=UPI00101DB9D7|nr:DNA polymerase I [Candidatus Chloroploca sp. Khr17]
MGASRRLALIDGHALAFRAFHALREAGLRSSQGEPTYAIFGFAQILLSMIQDQQPSHVAVAFDVGRTFRDDLYAEYKAGRAETPEEFHPQLERIKELITHLAIPIYTADGFEADDVIGTLARQATEADVATLILTGDTDSLQLVDDYVQVLLANPYAKGNKNTTLYDEAAVRERYDGLGPDQLADLRGLKGDASDNIPGVRGIGEKGAIALLKQFGSIEAIYARFDEVPKRYQKPLEGQREAALFSKHLATIVRDVPVTHLDLAACALGSYDRAAVIEFFQTLEIGATSNLIRKLPPLPNEAPGAPVPTPPPSATGPIQQPLFADLPTSLPDNRAPSTASLQLSFFATPAERPGPPPNAQLGAYQCITQSAQLEALIAELQAAPGFAFDVESSGLRPFESALVGIALAHTPGAGFYLPVGHHQGEQLPLEQVVTALRPLFADPNKAKYAHNAKFDLELLLSVDLHVEGLRFDTMLAAALLGKQRLGLKDLAFYELKLAEPPMPIQDLIGKGAKQISFAEVPIDQATPYAAADADLTLRLQHHLAKQLADETELQALFTRLEMPLIRVLIAMEEAGITLDRTYVTQLDEQLQRRIGELEAAIYREAGEQFNINSGQQLNRILFNGKPAIDPKVYGLSKLKSGGYSLTAEGLEQMSAAHPIAELILHYRQLSKLKSTYVDALPTMINPRTQRIHTSYNQVGAATGRLSSNEPNLQNIPVRTEEGRAIRRGFVALPGHQFVAADYSQIELRVLAGYTQDPDLVATFVEGRDIHAATAARLFGIEQHEVDKNQRRIAKTVVFGVIYGISAFGLAQRLGLERGEAQALIDGLFAQFPGIKAYIDTTLHQARTNGYVATLFGRRRLFPELRGNDRGPRAQAAMREAINAPIQGTAADIMKIAMVQLHQALGERQLQTRLLLQVHDELILEAPEHEVDLAAQLVREIMEGAYRLTATMNGVTYQIPLGVDVEIGPNWDALK